MDLGFANKVIFISGAGHGIGRAFALAFAEEGAAVAIGEIDPERGNSAAQEINSREGRALYVPCDVSDSSQVNAAVSRTLAEFGQIDVLVNNAAFTWDLPIK